MEEAPAPRLWIALALRVLVRALVLGPACAGAAALAIVVLDSTDKVPASLICGGAVGGFLAPLAAVEAAFGNAPRRFARALAAFLVAFVLSIGLGLLADVEIAYTVSRFSGRTPGEALERASSRAEAIVRKPRGRIELVVPVAIALSAAVAARAGRAAAGEKRAVRVALETAAVLLATVLGAGIAASVPDTWPAADRWNFSLFAVVVAVLAPACYELSDRLAAGTLARVAR